MNTQTRPGVHTRTNHTALRPGEIIPSQAADSDMLHGTHAQFPRHQGYYMCNKKALVSRDYKSLSFVAHVIPLIVQTAELRGIDTIV